MLPEKLAFVDLETTGARSAYDRIIEIGIIRVENNVITKTFHSLLNPLTHIPLEIERLTGISLHDVQSAPEFSAVTDEIMETLADCTFVAHNVRFDYAFLKNELKRVGIDFTAKHFCTVKLSQYLFPQYRHHNLDSLIKRFSLRCPNRHRALDDASVIHSFYQKILDTFPTERVIESVNKALRKPSLPLHLAQDDVDRLPELPGVYILYGDNTVPLYIGKSKNIKERVTSHFLADIRNGIEMKISQQIKSIETIPTAGELGALLLESQLIKEMLPLYNRQLRLKQQLTALVVKRSIDGYNTLGTETVAEITPSDLQAFSSEKAEPSGIIGFFRSVSQAKKYLSDIAKEYELCEKLLGLEKTTAGCFSYRLKRCRGACMGKEKALFYNTRLLEAIGSIKIKPWPFNGPIMITERNNLADKVECFLIDKWCYVGKSSSDSLDVVTDSKNPIQFDVDIYKILKRYLSVPGNVKNVRELEEAARTKLFTPEPGVIA